MYTEQMTQRLFLAMGQPPANYAANATPYYSGVVDMAKFKRALFVPILGVIDAAGTMDGRLQSCALANFASGVHNITGTNLTQVPNTAANTIVTMEIRSDQVAQQNAGDRYVRASTTITTNSIIYAILAIGDDAVQKPGNAQNNTSVVTQQVVGSS